MATANNSNDAAVLPKGAYVIVDGLQSDAGKKLNGGKGIILNKPTITDGVPRYPVLLYATKDVNGTLKVLDPTTNKKIKRDNLQLDPQDPKRNVQLYYACRAESLKVQQSGNANFKNALFWAEQLYKADPENNFSVSTTYANCLRFHERYDEAYAVIKTCGPLDLDLDSSHPSYAQFCWDYAVTRAKVGQEMDQALEYALKIPKDNTLRGDALLTIERACNHLMQEERNFENPEISSVHIQAALAIVELRPSDARGLTNLAAAYCLAGNNLEGARIYRRALATPGFQNDAIMKKGLILAQLQCPGMPLEHYDIIASQPTLYSCARKEDRNKFRMARKHDAEGGKVGTLMHAVADDVHLLQYQRPTDPDDPNVFPESLLEQIRP